jgi:hypothetical protein
MLITINHYMLHFQNNNSIHSKMNTGNTIHDFVEIKESRLLLKYSIPLENPANNILKAVLKPIAQGKRKF